MYEIKYFVVESSCLNCAEIIFLDGKISTFGRAQMGFGVNNIWRVNEILWRHNEIELSLRNRHTERKPLTVKNQTLKLASRVNSSPAEQALLTLVHIRHNIKSSKQKSVQFKGGLDTSH